MRAKDVMATQVVTVQAGDTVRQVAEKLLTHGVSALPVLDGNKLVGIVSEGDLLRRVEIGTSERNRSWWLRIFTGTETLAEEYVKSHARRVSDVMTKNVMSVSEDASLSEIAAVLEKNRIKRVPVMRDGHIVGIVSRANLIRGIATATPSFQSRPAPDGEIRKNILEALQAETWGSVGGTDVTVTNGVVELWGFFHSAGEREAARVIAENASGVREVKDHRVSANIASGYI